MTAEDAPKANGAAPRAGKPAKAFAWKPADATPLLSLLAVASLLLHVPTYLITPPAGVSAGLRALGLYSPPIPAAAPQSAPRAAKRYGDPDDGLDGPGFDGVHDYVCETGFKGVRILNRDPLMAVIDGFLRKGEPEYIMEMARPLLSRSSVVDVDNEPREKRNFSSEYRTSSSAFFSRSGDAVLRCIERRASAFSGVPVENTEGLQVTHYQQGQYYKAHYDYFPREFASMQDQLAQGGQRTTTLFAYLNTVPLPPGTDSSNAAPYVAPGTPRPKGTLVGAGSTQFPEVGLEVFPKKGNAAFWWDVDLEGQDDPRTLHAGTPPEYGEKWGLNIWTRERAF